MKIEVSFTPETDAEREEMNPGGLVMAMSAEDYEFSTPYEVTGEGSDRRIGRRSHFYLSAHCEGTDSRPAWQEK